jgi:ElaB/YqjD/DUF883 family membrane-anchored ribosome-binding protein
MNPADKQGQNGTNASGNLGATGSSGMEPTTPAMGASSSMTDPTASGIGINDTATRSGPDASESSAATGSTGGAMTTAGSSGGGERLARVKEEATKLRGQATDRARSAAEQGKTRATETIDGFARAVHDAAGNLEQQVSPQVAQYAHRAADALDNLSDSLRNKSVDELLDDARSFARRNPAVALGAAVAVGFALARFLKATSSPTTGSGRRSDYALDDEAEMPGLATTRTTGSTQPRYNA